MSGQVWYTNSLGGYMFAPNLSKKLRIGLVPMCKFRQFADIKEGAVGLHKGATFHWDVFSKVVTKGTTLTETDTMPETNFKVTQGTMTIVEAGNSVPYTGLLDNLSELPLTNIINNVLKADAAEVFDDMVSAEFNKTPLRVVPTAGTNTEAITLTTNGTATLTNSVPLGKEHVKSIADMMRERNIPGYTDSDYYALAHPTTLRKFKNDLEPVKAYTPMGMTEIKSGETGRYEGCRFAEQTNRAKETFAAGQSNWCFFFGGDTVAEGIAIPEEMRGKIPTDYGRSKGVAWYFLGGYALNHTAADQARVIKWDSAG